jgi:manganese/iron transport system permease protein
MGHFGLGAHMIAEFLSYPFAQRAVLACILGGWACGMAGVLVVSMRIPFVGVAVSHAALAGASIALALGTDPVALALVCSVGASVLVGPLAERSRVQPNVAMGVIFTVALGLAFLAMGVRQGARGEALALLWGSVLTVSWNGVGRIGATCGALIAFVAIFYKELEAILLSRFLARASGVHERAVFYAALALCGVVASINLTTVGGLLLFSLMVNPASAAMQLSSRLPVILVLSGALAAAAAVGGLFLSLALDLPAGALIILLSGALFGLAVLVARKRGEHG